MNLRQLLSMGLTLPTLLLLAGPIFVKAQKRVNYGVEVKANYRDSDQTKFPISFPFPEDFLPPGETSGSVETVDAGQHAEFSRISFFLEGNFSRNVRGRLKLDTLDKYDRNPTSTDNKIDLDEAWLEFGRDVETDQMPELGGLYVRLGKFAKFERQDDRNLESYGLVSTAFNRFEDAGLEIGLDMKNIYFKASITNGNPLFFRDPNALAGDNGTASRNPETNPFPNPDLKSGFVILYDAEIEDIEFGKSTETGLGVGFRLGDELGSYLINLMGHYYTRDLRDSVNLTGTFYSGDLDLLNGVSDNFDLPPALPLTGRKKDELGATLWVYAGPATFFGQYVASEIAGLEIDAFEGELSWEINTPWTLAIRGKPILSFIRPAARYSELDPKFVGNKFQGGGLTGRDIHPAPTIWWDWKKLDLGLNIGLYPGLLLTLEVTDNQFFRAGKWESNDETLLTLSYRWFSNRPS